ncbi:MAG: hypothetical protein ACOVVK_23235, partial [Elsteraceae bacterium]
MFRDPDDARFWDRIAQKYAADPIADVAGYEKSLERTVSRLRETDRVLPEGAAAAAAAAAPQRAASGAAAAAGAGRGQFR